MLCIDVNFAFFIVVLLFTFSRSETPCPKTFAGFDPAQHLQCKDIKWRCVDAVYCLVVRFKAVKQDPRITRRSASDGGDWSYVGDVPGPFSVLQRFKVFMRFFAAERDGEAPFFLARDRVRPYTYAAAMADLKTRCARVGVDGSRFGIHGIRVAGYNASVRANGHDLTICHGLWAGPSSASRYHRFDVSTEIVPMAANMVRHHMAGDRRVGLESLSANPEELASTPAADDTTMGVSVIERTLHPRRGSTPEAARQRKSSREATVNSDVNIRRARALTVHGSSPAPSSTVAAVAHETVLPPDVVMAVTRGGRSSNRVRQSRSQHQGGGLGH